MTENQKLALIAAAAPNTVLRIHRHSDSNRPLYYVAEDLKRPAYEEADYRRNWSGQDLESLILEGFITSDSENEGWRITEAGRRAVGGDGAENDRHAGLSGKSAGAGRFGSYALSAGPICTGRIAGSAAEAVKTSMIALTTPVVAPTRSRASAVNAAVKAVGWCVRRAFPEALA